MTTEEELRSNLVMSSVGQQVGRTGGMPNLVKWPLMSVRAEAEIVLLFTMNFE